MLRVESIIGSVSDPQIADRVHHVSHHGQVDFLQVSGDDLERRRLMKTTGTGLVVAITLPRHQKLFDGAVLHLEKTHAVVIRSEQQRWLRFVPASAEAALELGYHAGNLHWRVKFDGQALLVAQDGAAQTYTDRIAPLISSGLVSFAEVASS